MSVRRIKLCAYVDGDTKMSLEGIALLVGVTVDELRVAWDPADGIAALPNHLQHRAHERGQTARDASGDKTGTVVLAYWAIQDWGARIDFDAAGGVMWAVLDA